jgi:hypothetical protein
MIIESGRDEAVVDDESFDHEDPLIQLEQVLAEFEVFLAVHHEIGNRDEHNYLSSGAFVDS